MSNPRTPTLHGADRHTDVARERFIPCTGHTVGLLLTWGYYSCHRWSDAVLDYSAFTFKVPDDFVSFISVKLVWHCVAPGDMFWKMSAFYAAEGEDYGTHSDTPSYGTTTNGGADDLNVQEPANALSLSNLAKGDYIGIKAQRDATYGNDTLNTSVYVLGLLFTYMGEQ